MEGAARAIKLWGSRPSAKFIDDYSGVTEFDVSSGTIERIAKMQHVPVEAIDVVDVVVAPKDLVYGLARMFSMIDEQRHPNVHVVRTIAEAYRLLAVDAPSFNPIMDH